uniref:Uncharacterized protein n=1 Tax=Peronospora matthiolae TaxID=2874970 RepID=A0AAV1UPH0_9STRA
MLRVGSCSSSPPQEKRIVAWSGRKQKQHWTNSER